MKIYKTSTWNFSNLCNRIMQKIASVTNLMLDQNDVEGAPVVHHFCEMQTLSSAEATEQST